MEFTGARLTGSEIKEVRLCEEHNTECWDIINRERGMLSILAVVVGVIACLVGLFIAYMVLSGIILKISTY